MIYLINLPNFPEISPNIALGQFKAILTEHGMPCKVLDMQLVMANLLTPDEYRQSWCGVEWKTTFSHLAWAPYAWGGEHDVSSKTLHKYSHDETSNLQYSAQQLQWLEWYKSNILKLYISCTEFLQIYGNPKVIGFSCNMSQALPALATGRMIKSFFPQTKLVYGGPSFFGEMGAELIEKVDWIDAVATGESDDVVVELFSALNNGDRPSGLHGILSRRDDGSIEYGPSARPIVRKALENIPAPDYDDFFELANRLGLPENKRWRRDLTLYFEGTRGCWWAQKCQCKFCGRDKNLAPLRAKSSDRVYILIDSLYKTYPDRILRATDEAICSEHLETLLPKLNNYAKVPFLYYALRVDRIDRTAMQQLKKSCVYGGLVGIENLSTHLLQLLRKGTTQLQNIYFLKLSLQYNFITDWNLLYRIPGECREDYYEIEKLAPKIHHLIPPNNGVNPLQLHRFSQYFKEKSEICELEPDDVDKLMYPISRIDPYKVLYIFNATWKNTIQESAYQGLFQAVEIWRDLWRQPSEPPPQLLIHKYPGYNGIEIVDTRIPGRDKTHTLDQEHARIYELAADPCKFETIMDGLRLEAEQEPDADRVQTILEEFISTGLMISEKQKYIALAIPNKNDYPDGSSE